jgi:hypothetical protein
MFKTQDNSKESGATEADLPRGTARLLWAGIYAGPLFLGVWATQAFTRQGFDPDLHPISLLSLGDWGWVQIANFIVAGGLIIICSVGMRRAMRSGRGRVWAPMLGAVYGAGLIVAGVFVTDAGAGFPPGAPVGAPEMSWHGTLHEIGYLVAQLSWVAACVVLSRRFATNGQRSWMYACLIVMIMALIVSFWPDPGTFTVRILFVTALQFGLVAAVAWQLQRPFPVRT